jgi:hypothetical protein
MHEQDAEVRQSDDRWCDCWLLLVDDYHVVMLLHEIIYYDAISLHYLLITYATSHKCEMLIWNFIDEHKATLTLAKSTLRSYLLLNYESTGTDVGCRRGTSCCRIGATYVNDVVLTVTSRVVIFVGRYSYLTPPRQRQIWPHWCSHPLHNKKLTTEEENIGRRITLFHHGHHLNNS